MSRQQPFPTNGNSADMFNLPLRRDHSAMDTTVVGGGQVTTSYTVRDVLNGRGQGVQRHPGNVKYRTLVYANKVNKYLRAILLLDSIIFALCIYCEEIIFCLRD